MSEFRENLTRLMEERGFNMKSLSLAAGGGETLIRDILVRKRSPRQDKLADIARALGCSIADLYKGASDTAPVADEDSQTATESNETEVRYHPLDIEKLRTIILVTERISVITPMSAEEKADVIIKSYLGEPMEKIVDTPADRLKKIS